MPGAATLTAALGLVFGFGSVGRQPAPGDRLCPTGPTPRFTLNVPQGWGVDAVASGLTRPRSLAFDPAGRLLVVEPGRGITALNLNEIGCITSNITILSNTTFTHGLAFDPAGAQLYASTFSSVFRWRYNSTDATVSNRQTVVRGMNFTDADHVTRTLLIPEQSPDTLLVSVGSATNVDLATYDPDTGRSMIKAFDLTNRPVGGYRWLTQGRILAYGLRNEVGVAEDRSGQIWSVENSVDNLTRNHDNVTTDVHQDNPAEHLHLLGLPNNGTARGPWYGYPYCYSVWEPSLFPGETFEVGDYFVQEVTEVPVNGTISNQYCRARASRPAALLPPHSAPLDIKFGISPTDSNAYISYHGSWNRQPPTGYKVVVIPGNFTNSTSRDRTGTTVNLNNAWTLAGEWNSKTLATDILWNTNETGCSSETCFRPVGLAFSPSGDLYVSSDTSGEIFLLRSNPEPLEEPGEQEELPQDDPPPEVDEPLPPEELPEPDIVADW